MKSSSLFLSLICLGVLTGCTSPTRKISSHADGTPHLTATMPSKFDVVLNWQEASANCAGHIVEFATERDGPYTTLAYWPADRSSYKHSRLIPDTTFYYRIRPYCGPASAAVEVSLSAELSDADYKQRYAQAEDYSWGAPQTNSTPVTIERASIRNPNTAETSAPTGLKAVIAPETVSGVHLTWTDRDTDADGYLIEMKAENAPDYEVCAVVPPNVNSFGWSLHPPERKGTFRVRAYYLGQPSNLVSEKTGPESEATYLLAR